MTLKWDEVKGVGVCSERRAIAHRVLWLAVVTFSVAALQAKPIAGATQPSAMSAMGQLAQTVARARAQLPNGGAGTNAQLRVEGPPIQPGEDGLDTGPSGGQAELAIAVDATGQHIVVGYNDTRGFSLNPPSVSGFAYSDDGGKTFVDGGQLPTRGNAALNGSAGFTLLPQVYGDPDVKYVPGGNGLQFIYSSILITGTGNPPNFTGGTQTIGIHRSLDGGHTWQGPFEVTAATGQGAADKEFIDVDPDTGRVVVSWTAFGSAVNICTTFCDDIMTGSQPHWSPATVLYSTTGAPATGSIPRFGPAGSGKVYVAWMKNNDALTTTYSGIDFGNINLIVSDDRGTNWGVPLQLSPDFFPIDYIPGNDRVHSFPGLAVDRSAGTNQGNVYVVYAQNNNHDGSDIAFQRSTDGGSSFSAPMLLNSRPGNDRSQWFPYITVDPDTGRVSVVFYDQGVADSGDLMETTWVYSDDGGLTWSLPCPLSARPFHGGYGNDGGQPNLGDYIGAVARNGLTYGVWASTPPLVSFVDGLPGPQFSVPDFAVAIASNSAAPLNLGTVALIDSGGNGFLDPGEDAELKIPLRHYVTSEVFNPQSCTAITATLSTTSANVQVLKGTQSYPDIAPGQSGTSVQPFRVRLLPGFVAGSRIGFLLSVSCNQGTATLLFSQPTGTPIRNPLFSEDFNAVPPGQLPPGWTIGHQGGNTIVPWTTSASVPNAPGGNALFHINASDGTGGNSTRWERVSTPSIIVPTNVAYVTLDFDLWYDTEDDPEFNVLAYDGATLRILDQTAGHAGRVCLAEAFAAEIRTGSRYHFPKHLPRSGSGAYFQDMSVWGGSSGGWQHAHLELPGMAGTTIQLRWEYTQDSHGTGTDVRPTSTFCGVAIDNLKVQSVTFPVPPAFLAQASSAVPGTIQLSWPAVAGQTFEVQFKTDFADTNWSNLVQVIATNAVVSISDTFSNAPVRFYRIVAH